MGRREGWMKGGGGACVWICVCTCCVLAAVGGRPSAAQRPPALHHPHGRLTQQWLRQHHCPAADTPLPCHLHQPIHHTTTSPWRRKRRIIPLEDYAAQLRGNPLGRLPLNCAALSTVLSWTGTRCSQGISQIAEILLLLTKGR